MLPISSKVEYLLLLKYMTECFLLLTALVYMYYVTWPRRRCSEFLPVNLKYFRIYCYSFLDGKVRGSMPWNKDSTVTRWYTEPCIVHEFLGVLVGVSVAMTKHHDQGQFAEERVYCLSTSIPQFTIWRQWGQEVKQDKSLEAGAEAEEPMACFP